MEYSCGDHSECKRLKYIQAGREGKRDYEKRMGRYYWTAKDDFIKFKMMIGRMVGSSLSRLVSAGMGHQPRAIIIA